MGYFPFFMDIENKKIVIAGGGRVAFGKALKLSPFKPRITIVAPEVIKELEAVRGAEIISKRFEDSDADDAFAVIAATNDAAVNGHIYELCREKNIPVNTVDDREKCTFIFPALVTRENITVGISTGGKSPFFAGYLREYIEDEIDDEMMDTLEILGRYRSSVKSIFYTRQQRKKAFGAIFDLCHACHVQGCAPDDDDIKNLLEKLRSSYDN